MCHFTVYNAEIFSGAHMTYSHGWLRGLSSILKKVFFGTLYFTAEDALKSKSRRKQLELNFTLKYKWAGHNFEFGNLEGDITEPYSASPSPPLFLTRLTLTPRDFNCCLPRCHGINSFFKPDVSSQDSSLHHPTSFQPSSNVNLD